MRVHVTKRNTSECSAIPEKLEHPVGPATHEPKMFRVSWYISGLEIRKNSNADMNDTKNLASCFFPLQPHPQSGKAPI